MATRHDPWNMRLGGFVTSRSFREAAANYEKEQGGNKERPAARRQAGRVRPRALLQHQQPRAKRARHDRPPRRQCSGARRPSPPAPPPPQGCGTQFRLRWRLCPHSLCVILLKLLRTSVREVCFSTRQSHRNKKAATQFCSLAACVSAWVLQGKVRKARKTSCRAKKHISKTKKKQGFCMKMERKHFAGPRNILQTKRQGFCVVFLSILKIGPTGPTTGHWTENWSFYLILHHLY